MEGIHTPEFFSMPAPYSDDFRQKAIEAVERGERKSRVCGMFNISRNTLDLWLKRLEQTGSVSAIVDYQRGPTPKINDLDAFREFAQQHGHLTQKDMAQLWPEPISDHTLGKALHRIGFTRKKKTYGYRERDEQARQAFIAELQKYSPEQLVYSDEAGANNALDYGYGWCARSERFYDLKLGHPTERVNMIAWCARELLAPMTFKGSCNTNVVESWVEQCLVPQLKTGQVVIMDNASFHKSGTIRELIEQAGCKLLFLPAYSPDLNKIEKFWAKLKSHLRKIVKQFENFWDAVDHAFILAS